MPFTDISPPQLLVDLFEEQQETIAGGVVYQEQYHYEEKHEEKTEYSSKEEKTEKQPFWFNPSLMFSELDAMTFRIIEL